MTLLHRGRDLPPAVAEADLPPGFRPVALLAHGRRLDTWDAWDEERQARVVIKVVRPDRRAEPRVVDALLLEGEIASTLAHPHLVRGYGVFTEPPSVVLETQRGATLAAEIDRGALALPDVAELGLQLTSVLGYLHSHEWLHLDVKPANVVVDHGRAVLIDLSLAARPGDGRPGAGTRGYLAPEQARGVGLSAATDVWGLGATLLEALTGEVPFGDEGTWDSRRRWPIVHRPMPRSAYGIDGVPVEVRALLTACVDLDPAARPRLSDVRAGLTPFVEGLPWA
jgi:serine/threonine protein kinase